MKQILVLDDDLDIQRLLQMFLSKKGYRVSTASNIKDARALLRNERFDLVLSDQKLPDGDGLEFSKQLLEENSDLPVIMITAYSDVRLAVKAVKRGIFDYITKPLLPDELLLTVNRALGKSDEGPTDINSQRKSKKQQTSIDDRPDQERVYIVGKCPASTLLYKHIEMVAPTDMSVIIQGETGSGKEYVAREIHQKSNRASGPFVALDCGALPSELAGSILFGHKKGAFTGALQDRVGSFEHANGGTIFLDEIGNLAMEHQIKLLRLLQERSVQRLGTNNLVPLDVRVLVASNDDLQKMVREGLFRQDLFFRLNEFAMRVPSLRERGDDILLLANHFLSGARHSLGKQVEGFSEKTCSMLMEHSWPGNLRELQNVVKRAVLLTDGSTIESSALPTEISMPNSYFLKKTVDHDASDLKEAAQNAEQQMILDALAKTGNNKTKAAELLNIDRKTLYNKLKQMARS